MQMKNVEDVYPLSPMQQGMLFHSLYAPGDGAYVEQVIWTLDGAFDEAAFDQAWRQVIARHAALRTCFFWEGLKQPLQVVRQKVELLWERYDWSGWSAAEQQAKLQDFLETDSRRNFELTAAPLLRLSQTRLSKSTHQFVWTYHHILLDGWSVSLVLKEVFQCYQAVCSGVQPRFEERRPFRDYIGWLQRQEGSESEVYWRETLRGFVAPTPLGTRNNPEPARNEAAGYPTEQVRLSWSETEKLREFARGHQLTLGALVTGAWALLLSRYSDERDVVFGTVVTGRPPTLSGVETMVGLFINTLPVRVSVPRDAHCVSWLKQVHQQQLEMRRYEHSQLAQIHEWSDVPGGQQLFESIVAFDNAPDDQAVSGQGEGVEITNVFRANTNTSYPVTLGAVAGSELTLLITYQDHRFDAESIARMLKHLENLLMAFVNGAEQRLSDLPYLEASEQHQLLTEWNQTTVHYPAEANIPRLFEAEVERNPDAVALIFEGTHLTYAELNRRSNRLAHHLRRLGVGPETLVGICAERSQEMIWGLLGILKAGAAYLPLDPAYPRESLAFMLKDAGVAVLLTQSHFASALPDCDARVVLLEEDSLDGLALECDQNPQVHFEPDSVAYAIYTSGSTGTPKAVLNTHRAITNRLLWMRDAYELTEADCALQKTPFTFDVSIWEIFLPLVIGARLVLARPGGHQDNSYLAKLMAESGVTVVDFVPSMLEVFLDTEGIEECRQLKHVLCGGEAMSFELQQRFFSCLDAELHHLYGPTENAIDATFWRCARASGTRTVPIGRPLANVRIYLLNRELQPTPVGVAGELHIAGLGVARGYLNRPDLSAEKFIPNPFGGEVGGRLYKTGDLARYLPDGNIEFLGRLDYQVKIRGFRIELGEVEARLSEHPSVRDVVAIARAVPAHEKRLIAYVTPAPGHVLKPSQLRRFLMERVPQHMLPSAIVMLERLPRTSNGKVDRSALPNPRSTRPELDEPYVGPSTAAEKALVAIWADVLGLEGVGIHDNFFELGGDSIISIQVVSRAKQAGLNLVPRDLFEHQTIAELGAIAAQVTTARADQGIVTGSLPLTPIQHWFFDQSPVDSHHYNQALMLAARQTLNPALLEQAVKQLVEHHDALRLRFSNDEMGWQQLIASPEAATIFLRVDLSELAEPQQERVKNAAAADLQASLDLRTGPLLRVALFDFGSARANELLLVIHHLAVDGVSWRILVEDLQFAYEQLRNGAGLALPPKTTSLKEWAERLAKYSQSEVIGEETDYWLAELGKVGPPLPLDFMRGENTVESAREVMTSLSIEETRALLQDVPKAYHTQINDVLLTALAQAFSGWTGQQGLLINLEGHGRENLFADLDATRTVGWFTSLFPVDLDVDERSAPGAALCSVKEHLRSIPKRGVGYGLLRYLNEKCDPRLREARQAEVCFNYLGQFDQLFRAAALFQDAGEAPGATRSLGARRNHLLNIDGGIGGGQLSMRWTYSRNLHLQSTIEGLARNFSEALRALIVHCQSPAAGGFTPSDFPLARLTQPQIGELSQSREQIEDIYALSPMQEGMLFHAVRSPKSEVYCEQMGFQLQGALDIASFERAWQEMFERHAILRTSFRWQSVDEPLQVVHQKVRLPLAREDWRDTAVDAQVEKLEAFCQAEHELGFVFILPPLMRLTLIQMDEQSFELIWSYHHMLLDGWSVQLLFREVLEVYESLTQGHQPRPEERRPYRDYVAWLQQQDIPRAKAFWRENLRGFNAPTPLIGGAPSRTSASEEVIYDQRQILLSRKLTDSLRTLTRAQRLTLNTLTEGCWALLLSRYSGERDVVFGATVSGRPADLAGAETMIGLFINTLPVRVQISDDEKILPWLKRLQAQQAEVSQYMYSPLAEVQRWSGVPRGGPLFESLMVFENYPVDASLEEACGSLEISSARNVERTDYPLTLVVVPGEELAIRLLYDCRRFERAAMMRMLDHFRRLLEGVATDITQQLSQLSLLSEAEKHVMLVEWNDTRAEYPTAACFHHLVEQQVKKTPDALALSFEEQRLSYGELNTRANQLAHYLRSLGVGPEACVGICLERSPELVIARLAVLKAGGAYVSLDPEYPAARLSFMLEDARALVLLTQQRLVEHLPALSARVVCLDTDRELISQENINNPDAELTPGNLAYVYYTSGSTGKPKGVQIEHAGLVNLVTWHNRAYQVTPADRKSQLSGLAFDASVWELWPYLAAGASAHIPNEETRSSWPKLLAWLVAEAITICFLPTPLAEAVMDDKWPAGIALRALLTGGDKLHRWPRQTLPFAFVNKYGPTEVSAVTTWMPMDAVTDRDASPPIGRPIANTQTFVLDDRLQPVPVGVAGELYIGGVGLARGYLNDPELTAEKFIPHPFSDEPGARMYRSGDLARYSQDGQIEFLGRVDHQVKIRGYRIELGEIDAALGEHAAIRGAITLACDELPGGKQLVAYFVSAQVPAPTVSELRGFLQERLPEYTIPHVFVQLESLPLTPNGKVDRRALPTPQRSEAASNLAYLAPRTPVEEVLAKIWAQVLGLDRVGVHDNFFELGGDSILSIRIIARAGQKGIELSPNQLFLHPTIGELADNRTLPASAQPLAESYTQKSQPLTAPGVTPPTSNLTLAHFPDADLSQRELDHLLTRLATIASDDA